MWERDLKAFAEDYNFVSLQFAAEEADSTVADEATSATVRICVVVGAGI